MVTPRAALGLVPYLALLNDPSAAALPPHADVQILNVSQQIVDWAIQLFGGWLTDRFGKEDKRWYLKIPAYAIMLTIPCAVGAIFLRDTTLTVICLGLCASLQSVYLGPSLAVAHSLVPASRLKAVPLDHQLLDLSNAPQLLRLG